MVSYFVNVPVAKFLRVWRIGFGSGKRYRIGMAHKKFKHQNHLR